MSSSPSWELRQRSAGRRRLLHVLQIMPGREVALRCHVSPMAVSHWASGRCMPGARARRMLAEHCGVPVHLWERMVKESW